MSTETLPLPIPDRSRRGPLAEPLDRDAVDQARVYVWEIPVRVTHWSIALAIVVLSATGLYMGHPFLIAAGRASQHFLMGMAKLIHFYAAIVFTLAVLARIAWMFLGNRYARWNKMLPVGPHRRRALLPTIQFYLFLRRRPPGFIGHNPAAGMAYTAIFTLYLAAIATGLALYAISAPAGSPMRWFGALLPWMGGAQIARWIHHVVMWLLLGFACHHVYSGLLMSQLERNATMESIFSGYKFVPREDLVLSGYRLPEGDAAAKPGAEAPHA